MGEVKDLHLHENYWTNNLKQILSKKKYPRPLKSKKKITDSVVISKHVTNWETLRHLKKR